MVFIVL